MPSSTASIYVSTFYPIVFPYSLIIQYFLRFDLFAVQTLLLYLNKVGSGVSTHVDIIEEDYRVIGIPKKYP